MCSLRQQRPPEFLPPPPALLCASLGVMVAEEETCQWIHLGDVLEDLFILKMVQVDVRWWCPTGETRWIPARRHSRRAFSTVFSVAA